MRRVVTLFLGSMILLTVSLIWVTVYRLGFSHMAQTFAIEMLTPVVVGWCFFAIVAYISHLRQVPPNQAREGMRPYMSYLRITALCIYNVSLGFLSLYVLLAVLQGPRSFFMFFNLLRLRLGAELLLLLVVVSSGVLSASIQHITSITLRKLRGDIGTERTIFYALGPFIGMGIALLTYFFIASYLYSDIPNQGVEYNENLAAGITGIIVIALLTMLEKVKTK